MAAVETRAAKRRRLEFNIVSLVVTLPEFWAQMLRPFLDLVTRARLRWVCRFLHDLDGKMILKPELFRLFCFYDKNGKIIKIQESTGVIMAVERLFGFDSLQGEKLPYLFCNAWEAHLEYFFHGDRWIWHVDVLDKAYRGHITFRMVRVTRGIQQEEPRFLDQWPMCTLDPENVPDHRILLARIFSKKEVDPKDPVLCAAFRRALDVERVDFISDMNNFQRTWFEEELRDLDHVYQQFSY